MKKRLVTLDRIKDLIQHMDLMFLEWGVVHGSWCLLSGDFIKHHKHLQKNTIYWYTGYDNYGTGEQIGVQGFLIMVENTTFYSYEAENEDEDIEANESKLYEIIQNGLDYETALDFLCL